VVHGARDILIPVAMGRELYQLAAASGGPTPTFLEVPKAGHNDVLGAALPEYAALMNRATSEYI